MQRVHRWLKLVLGRIQKQQKQKQKQRAQSMMRDVDFRI